MPKTKKLKAGAAQPSNEVPVEERIVNGYLAENAEKWNRAVFGSIGSEGALSGGVGENASGEAKLANYDKLGGLITKDRRKVKTGSFYDFEKRAAREVPEVVLVFRDLEGNLVEVPEGEEVPIEVKAAEIAGANKKAKSQAKSTNAKSSKVGISKKAKPSIEDEE